MTEEFPSKGVLLTKADRLASLPAVAQRVLAEIDRESSTNVSLARALSMDPPLAGRAMNIANSVFYARGGKTSLLDQAIARLGRQELRGVVLNASIVTVFGLEHEQLRNLYIQSLISALATESVLKCSANVRRSGKDNPAFVAALLCDIGLFLLNRLAPAAIKKCAGLLKTGKQPLVQIERTVLGYTHCDLGADLLTSWELAPVEVEACRWHHATAGAPAGQQMIVRVVHVADSLARGVLQDNLVKTQQLACEAGVLEALGISDAGLKALVGESSALLKRARELEAALHHA